MQIQQLEQELQTLLFQRDRRSVRLTSAGAFLLVQARVALASAAQLVSAAEQWRRGESGILCIGFTPTAPQVVLPDLVRRFRSQCPEVTCNWQELSSREQLAGLERGTLDAGIVRVDGTEGFGKLQFLTLMQKRFVVAVPSDDTLATRKRIRLAQLANKPWVMVQQEVSPSAHNAIERACQAEGFSPNVAHGVSQVHAVLAHLGAGLGVSLVPSSARHLRARPVSLVPLTEAVTTELALGFARDARSPVLAAFVRVAAEAFRPSAKRRPR